MKNIEIAFLECDVRLFDASIGTIFPKGIEYIEIFPKGLIKDNNFTNLDFGPIKSWSICLPNKYILGNLLPVIVLEKTEVIALVCPYIQTSGEDERYDYYLARRKSKWVLKKFLSSSIYN
ncbi:MAG: hypothetical protein HZB99_01450 [Candidatus Harrisonbacteria bacterium]|nr:hypothetical protein [Candidatus Harrisonbacteria bacterium]